MVQHNIKQTLMSVVDLTTIPDRKEQKDEIWDALAFCKLNGFGGRCFAAAMAIRDVLLRGKGTVVVALNAALSDTLLISGHAAVLYLGRYWDAEGDHNLEHIKDYARFEVDDVERAERYTAYTGKTWTEETAQTVRVAKYPNGLAISPDQEADYAEFAGALLAVLKLKTETQPERRSGNEANK
jgi:hypothetical protein